MFDTSLTRQPSGTPPLGSVVVSQLFAVGWQNFKQVWYFTAPATPHPDHDSAHLVTICLCTVMVMSRPVLCCYRLVGKHLPSCRIQVPPSLTPQQAVEQHWLYLKGNMPVISNQDLTWSLPIKTGSLPSFCLCSWFHHSRTSWEHSRTRRKRKRTKRLQQQTRRGAYRTGPFHFTDSWFVGYWMSSQVVLLSDVSFFVCKSE